MSPAGLRRDKPFAEKIGVTPRGRGRGREEERKGWEKKLKGVKFCSTCQCHNRIAQIGCIFRRSSSEETCQTCPDDRCSLE